MVNEKLLDDIKKFERAENKAFEQKGIAYGEVEFECPLCGGQAWATRKHTPENPAHEVTVRGHCPGCGMTYMN